MDVMGGVAKGCLRRYLLAMQSPQGGRGTGGLEVGLH